MEWIVFGIAALTVAAFWLLGQIKSAREKSVAKRFKSQEYRNSLLRLRELVNDGRELFKMNTMADGGLAGVILADDWYRDVRHWDSDVLGGGQAIPLPNTFRFWNYPEYTGFPDSETVGNFNDMHRFIVSVMAGVVGVPEEHVGLMEESDPELFGRLAESLVCAEPQLHIPYTPSTIITLDEQRELYGTPMSVDEAVEYCVRRLKEVGVT